MVHLKYVHMYLDIQHPFPNRHTIINVTPEIYWSYDVVTTFLYDIPFFEKSILKSSYSTTMTSVWQPASADVSGVRSGLCTVWCTGAAFESHKQMRGDEEAFLLFHFWVYGRSTNTIYLCLAGLCKRGRFGRFESDGCSQRSLLS